MNEPTVLDARFETLRRRVAELERALADTQELQHWKLQLAAQVHRSLLPRPFRDPRIWVDIRYVPIEEVGGDYCQVRFCDPDRLYFTISDVTGHGVAAALLAACLSSEIRYSIVYGREPRDVVRSLNEVVCNHFAETNLYLTFFVARVDLHSQTITCSGAGHPAPVLVRRGGQRVEVLDSQNPMIGITRDILCDVPEQTLPLARGDRLVFYTDGLSETSDAGGRRLGTGGLAKIAADAARLDLFRMADHMLRQIADYQHGATADDKTLIVAEMR